MRLVAEVLYKSGFQETLSLDIPPADEMFRAPKFLEEFRNIIKNAYEKGEKASFYFGPTIVNVSATARIKVQLES